MKPIPRYEGLYSITDNGDVYSHGRKIMRSDGRPRTIKGRWMSKSKSFKDYDTVALTDFNGVIKKHYVHRLVAAAFYGQSDLVVDHIDGNTKNNHASNLRYCTASENLTFRNTSKTYKSQHPHIYFDQSRGRYRVALRIGGKTVRGKSCATLDDAQLCLSELRQ